MKKTDDRSAKQGKVAHSVAHAALCVAVFYLMMALLNGAAMERSAEFLEYGAKRDALLRLNAPIAYLSRKTGAWSFRELIRHNAGDRLNNHN